MKNNKNESKAQLRTLSVNTGKIERADNNDTKTLRGYAVVFSDEYKYEDWWTGDIWTEKIDRNAFDGVDMSNVLMLRDHNYSRVLGRNGKNLRIEVDDVGVFFELELPNTELARETYELVEIEVCDQCSFGFTIREYKRDLGNKTETITKVDNLFELTITPIPAYRSTVVTTMCEARQESLTAEKRKRDEAEQKAAEEARAESVRREAETKAALEAERNKLLEKIGV